MNIPNYSSYPLNSTLNKELDKVIPLNPNTGLRDDIFHKYEIALTDSERHNLESYLQTQDIKNPDKQLSDKDLVALCPSRFVNTLSDVKQLAKAMRDVVSELDMDDEDAAVAAASPASSTPMASSTSAPSK